MEGTERRRERRYSISVPAELKVGSGKESKVLELRTRDVSSAGAFLDTPELIDVGTAVRVELFISAMSLLEIIKATSGARIRVTGRIVRCTPEGVAVEFAKGFRIRPMRRVEE